MQPPPTNNMPPSGGPGTPGSSPFSNVPPTQHGNQGFSQFGSQRPAQQPWQQPSAGLGQPFRPQPGNFASVPGNPPPQALTPTSSVAPPRVGQPIRSQPGNFANFQAGAPPPPPPGQTSGPGSTPTSPGKVEGLGPNFGPSVARPGGSFVPGPPFSSSAPHFGRQPGPPGPPAPPGPPGPPGPSGPPWAALRPPGAALSLAPSGFPQGSAFGPSQPQLLVPPPSGGQHMTPSGPAAGSTLGSATLGSQQRPMPSAPPVPGYSSAVGPPPPSLGNAFSQMSLGPPIPGYPNAVAPPPPPLGGQFTGGPGPPIPGHSNAPGHHTPPPTGGQFTGVPSAPSGVPSQFNFPSTFANAGQNQRGPGFAPPPQPTPPYIGSSFATNQFGAPPQGMHGAGPPLSSAAQPSDGQLPYGPPPPSGYSDPMARSLPEEFQSISMVPLPGSMEPGVDPSALPRPSDDTELPAPTWAANCHPRYLRLTCNAMPNSHSLVARWHLPLGAVVHPLAEAPPGEEVPVVSFGATSIVRCRRCRAYVNAYVSFADAGRRWRCNICVLLNEVPVEYFCPLDANGRRKDADERPELSQASVEYVASTEYMVRPPMPPVYFFLIDVSVSAIRTGMLQVACETIKSSLDKLPGFPRTQIGFITFDSTLHFYSLKSSLTQPQMMVVAELDDPFLPMPDDLLVNLSESRSVVEALLDSLPTMFQNNVNVESALGPALKASFMVMSQLGGKLLVFQSTLPSLGVGRLKLRGDDPRIYGTEKECTLRVTDEQFYKQMAADFSKYQIGVNIYAFAEKYIDIASLGTLSKYTGGQIIYYQDYQSCTHSKKFSYELARDLSRETAWEAVMRIRCGKGIRFSTYHGHFMLRSSDLLALPAVDVDKAFAMQLTLEDTLLTSQTVYFQVALLYTSSAGERRIRVHTMATPVTADLGEMYRSADAGAIASIMSRLAIEKSLVSKLEDARQATQARLVKSLREYRNLFAVQHRTTGRLIFPESLKLLPLYVLAINKSLALRGSFNDVHADDRSAAAFEMQIIPIPRLLKLLYPSLYRFDDYLYQSAKLKPDSVIQMPSAISLTAERLDPRGAYFLDDGLRFVLWVGKVLPLEFTGLLFGTEVAQSADSSKVAVVPQNNDLSKFFISVLDKLRAKNRALYQECFLVRQGEQPRESHLLLSNLVEDRAAPPFGYVDWLIQIHRLVQQNS